jgi:hypothetical protein
MKGAARASGQRQPQTPGVSTPPPPPAATSQDDNWADEDEEREDLPPPPPSALPSLGKAAVDRGARLGELKVRVPSKGRKEDATFPIHVNDSPVTLRKLAEAFVKKHSLAAADTERLVAAAVRKHSKKMKKK